MNAFKLITFYSFVAAGLVAGMLLLGIMI